MIKNKILSLFPTFEKVVFILYLYAFGIILPLYYDDLYFNMMEAKASEYEFLIALLFVPIIIILIKKIIKKEIFSRNKILIFSLLVLLFITFLSTILSNDIANSFFGNQGWFIGFLIISSSILSIIVFKDISIKTYFYYPVILTTCFVYLCSILHSFEIDILNLHYNILEVSFHKYLTTIGNINWYTGYLSLTVPLFVGLGLLKENVKEKILFLVTASLGLISISLLGSDGIFLGLGFLSFFIIPFLFNNKNNIKMFSILIIVFGIGLIIARNLDYCMDGYAALLRRRLIIIPLFIVGIGLFIFSSFIKEEIFNKVKKIIIWAIEITLLLAVIIFIVLSINSGDSEWGTGRIAIWKDSLTMYSCFTFKNKIFGIGLENLYQIYGPLNERYRGIYLSSHSEWIQMLLTCGALGFFSYLFCWICIIVKYIKSFLKTNKKIFPYAFGLICYFGQSLVNSATTCNVAILSIIVILFISNCD